MVSEKERVPGKKEEGVMRSAGRVGEREREREREETREQDGLRRGEARRGEGRARKIATSWLRGCYELAALRRAQRPEPAAIRSYP